ncbi:glycosyltransferase [Fictibacillus sp. 5RED26]|uniref:glycosyltransferase family protein n=1 Tax=Fictibacillus sp. 5RED26 TaxID=2745876 RepID=UPI0018CFB7F5|nr:glycosyltransferase [Fictibacillus sp. 5RED26]MBH0155664.1 glycosyltransferase [Fictibacillus sp. 5RED26]
MSKLNILFISKNTSQFIDKSSHYLYQELQKHVNVEVWSEHASIQYILSRVQRKPDFILFNDIHKNYSPFINGLETLNVPSGMIVHDLHYNPKLRERIMKLSCIKVLFPHYKEAFIQTFPSLSDKVHWFPHHVNENVFKDYQITKETDVLMVGANYPHLYPLRAKIMQEMQTFSGFKTFKHPGYRDIKAHEKEIISGAEYAKEMNAAKLFITCDSIYQYPLLKYFEVLASNTLLLAPGSPELNELGFIDGQTFVQIDLNNYKEKITYYLANEIERNVIARQGYEMVHERHTSSKRALEMIHKIQTIIERKL